MVIEVNKDIDRYQESVAMGLTARQLIFSIASVVVGGGIVLLLYKYIGLTYVSTEGEPIIKAFEMEQNGQVKKKAKKLNQRLQHLSRQ